MKTSDPNAQLAIQDQIRGNHCFGCGSDNPGGLRIKSYWQDDGTTICRFRPEPHHAAASATILNGGIVATLVDCHCVCTAMADAYRRAGRGIGSDPTIWYATGRLDLRYLQPSALAGPVELIARVVDAGARKSEVHCSLSVRGDLCAEGDVVEVRVPPEWLESHA